VPAGVEEAASGAVARHFTGDRLTVSLPLSSRVCGAPLILHASTDTSALDGGIRRAWLGIGAIGIVAMGIAAVAAAVAGARLVRPLEALARSARRLGDGDFSTRAPRSGLPEPDQIADALDTTADRLGRAVARGTSFTADASHQLRTPLTALRLHLEASAAGDGHDEAIADALAEADRLEATIHELVSLTRVDGPDAVVDLAPLVEVRAAAWQVRAARAGRDLVVDTAAGALARARPAAVSQAVEVLVDNALDHGRGRILVQVTPAVPGHAEAGVRLCVADQGPGPSDDRLPTAVTRDRAGVAAPAAEVPLRRGRGLVLARALVEGEGGRLVLGAHADGWRACLVLPGPDGAPGPHQPG